MKRIELITSKEYWVETLEALQQLGHSDYEIATVIANKMTEVMNYIPCCKSDSEQLKDRKIKDLLNWVKSDLKQETNNKLSKTATPYRTDKIRFLNKLLELQNL